MFATLSASTSKSSSEFVMERPAIDRENLARILATAGAARARRLTLEETFIFLAIGHLGLSATRSGYAVKPVPCADIAALLKIPKETVRRKAQSLEILGLVAKNSRGVALDKIDEWLDLAAAMLPSKRISGNAM